MAVKRSICLICGQHFYGELGGEVSLYCECSEVVPAAMAPLQTECKTDENNHK